MDRRLLALVYVDLKDLRTAQRKSDEGVIEVESSVSSGSEYQSSSLEENTPRSSEFGEQRGEQEKKTNLTGNQRGRKEQPVNKRKRSIGTNESLVGLTKQQHKKQDKRKELENQESRFSKEDQALTAFDPEVTSPRKLVLDFKEEQCKSKGDQSCPEENHLGGQVLTINTDSPNNNVGNSRSKF
ncbi:hypothetical protein TNCV_4467841 [Trichonephila clavipes]|nr:hypothetical protein TNCV_4467841 [Trichonephila clavipes]